MGRSSCSRARRRRRPPASGRVACLLLLAASLACGGPSGAETTAGNQLPSAASRPDDLARLGGRIEELSEPGAYFDTDNLISNERSFPRSVELLEPRGGVYLGVGPEQNFSLIARLRPEWAFVVDIRRHNMVQHLLLHSVLLRSPTPEAYVRTLLSLPPTDADSGDPDDANDLAAIVARLDEERPSSSQLEANVERHLAHVDALGIVLDDDDRRHLRHVAREFHAYGLDLRFRSHGRGLSRRYPTYRDLVLAETTDGSPASFLASPDDYRFVRELARAGRLVPVVGDFAGESALRRIGAFARERELEVTAFYTSNVEFYLWRNGVFARYLENLDALPLARDGLFLRACFDYGEGHPLRRPGERSVIVLQEFAAFERLRTSGELQRYWDLCTRGVR